MGLLEAGRAGRREDYTGGHIRVLKVGLLSPGSSHKARYVHLSLHACFLPACLLLNTLRLTPRCPALHLLYMCITIHVYSTASLLYKKQVIITKSVSKVENLDRKVEFRQESIAPKEALG